MLRRVVLLIAMLALAGCGSSATTGTARNSAYTGSGGGAPHAHPQVVEPTVGQQAAAVTPSDPVGDVHAHATPLSEVRHELKLELVYAPISTAGYINPLPDVIRWERTDQGVDAALPVGAPIVAPGPVKILAIEPDWYAGQPLIYWELLNGPQAGQVQYVAEEITDLARPGTYLQQGQVIARYARSGTGIEFGWSTPNGTTLAVATTGYEEGQITWAGRRMRAWLNALGAGAGPNF
jgi:hypothetical protein